MPTKLGAAGRRSMTRPCECGLGLRPRRLFGFPMEPVDGAPCFFSGSLTLGGCGLPSTDSARRLLRGRQWQDTRGQQHQSFGRSRGGFSTKIHLKTDLDGNPLDFHLTAGEVSDSTQFEISLDIGPDIRPRIAMTDKGYDSEANRVAALARGITPVIPRRENSKRRGRFFPKRLYKLRARIEQAIGKLKRFKRVAMRCEKTDISYSAIISFACGLMLVKSVHTA